MPVFNFLQIFRTKKHKLWLGPLFFFSCHSCSCSFLTLFLTVAPSNQSSIYTSFLASPSSPVSAPNPVPASLSDFSSLYHQRVYSISISYLLTSVPSLLFSQTLGFVTFHFLLVSCSTSTLSLISYSILLSTSATLVLLLHLFL